MNTDALREKATALHRSGQLAEAERLYRDVLAADPRDFPARHLLGIIRAQRGHYEEALREIDAALALKPDDTDAHLNRANVLKVMGRAEEALAGYARALDLKPGWPQALNNRILGVNVIEDFGSLAAVTAASDAIWFTSPYAATAELDAGRLCELPRAEHAPHAQVRILIYTLERRSQSPWTRSLKQLLRQQIKILSDAAS